MNIFDPKRLIQDWLEDRRKRREEAEIEHWKQADIEEFERLRKEHLPYDA